MTHIDICVPRSQRNLLFRSLSSPISPSRWFNLLSICPYCKELTEKLPKDKCTILYHRTLNVNVSKPTPLNQQYISINNILNMTPIPKKLTLPILIPSNSLNNYLSFHGVGCKTLSSANGFHHHSFAIYHSTVSFNASSKSYLGFQPSSLLIFEEFMLYLKYLKLFLSSTIS